MSQLTKKLAILEKENEQYKSMVEQYKEIFKTQQSVIEGLEKELDMSGKYAEALENKNEILQEKLTEYSRVIMTLRNELLNTGK